MRGIPLKMVWPRKHCCLKISTSGKKKKKLNILKGPFSQIQSLHVRIPATDTSEVLAHACYKADLLLRMRAALQLESMLYKLLNCWSDPQAAWSVQGTADAPVFRSDPLSWTSAVSCFSEASFLPASLPLCNALCCPGETSLNNAQHFTLPHIPLCTQTTNTLLVEKKPLHHCRQYLVKGYLQAGLILKISHQNKTHEVVWLWLWQKETC